MASLSKLSSSSKDMSRNKYQRVGNNIIDPTSQHLTVIHSDSASIRDSIKVLFTGHGLHCVMSGGNIDTAPDIFTSRANHCTMLPGLASGV